MLDAVHLNAHANLMTLDKGLKEDTKREVGAQFVQCVQLAIGNALDGADVARLRQACAECGACILESREIGAGNGVDAFVTATTPMQAIRPDIKFQNRIDAPASTYDHREFQVG